MQQLKAFISGRFTFHHLLKWCLLSFPLALVTGSVVALFLWLLDQVTMIRWRNGWLLFLLPVAGIAIHYLYKLYGGTAERGNNLIIDEIHEPGGGVPLRMTPLILGTTLITHLFGGSAGREGTAVQIGGSIAATFGKLFRLSSQDVQILLMSGIAAGFGAVFGTPAAGAVFALEVLAIGNIRYSGLLPCLLAAIIADYTCSAWGIHHTQYHIATAVEAPKNGVLLVKVIAAGILFGYASQLFITTTHAIKAYSERMFSVAWLMPFAGGCIVILLTCLLGAGDYLGLGVTNPDGVSIVSSFQRGGAGYLSWFWKLLFTAITLGTGYKGGEVTPLFFIGATLGNTLAMLSGAPIDLMAGIGFIAVFAGATNTPIACTIMGAELFGSEHVLYYFAACIMAYYFSGKKGIYHAQRPSSKTGRP